jgi:hypothetical protein
MGSSMPQQQQHAQPLARWRQQQSAAGAAIATAER